jgi:glycosyltransferase involved in cell wall biosynthesis
LSAHNDVAVHSPAGSAIYSAGATGGGAEYQAYMLACELARSGMRVAHVVYPVEGGAPAAADGRPSVVERPPYGGEVRLVGSALEGLAIWRGLERANADCIVVRGSGGGPVRVAASFARARRRRFVFSSSSGLDFRLTRHDRSEGEWRAFRRAVRRADHIVVQNWEQLELARESFPDVPITRIPSFAQAAQRSAAEPDALLWADRLMDYKRPELFLELAAALPELRFRMIVVITNESSAWYPDLVESVQRRAAGLPNVELLPHVPRQEMLEYISRAIAVVKTSAVEGMPNTFLEAWARGVPVVSLSVDPDRRIVDHEIGVFANDSTERLAQAVEELAANPDLRRQMGDRAQAFIQEVHSPSAVGRDWRTVLEPLVR